MTILKRLRAWRLLVDTRGLTTVEYVIVLAITGCGPFDAARDANELFLAHLAQEAPPVSSRAAGVPAELDQWLSRLLAKKPEERPGDAAAVAVELRALRKRLSGAPPPSEPSRPEDRTIPGGPFDTLEAAQTVASDGQGRARSSVHEVTTRTGIGLRGADQSGQTLRLETLPIDQHVPLEEPEAPTRTAALAAAPSPSETPPPVEPSRRSVGVPASKGRGPWVVGAVVVGAALAVAAAVLLRARGLPGSSAVGAAPQAEPLARALDSTGPRGASSADPVAVTVTAPAAPPASVTPVPAQTPAISGVRSAAPPRPGPAVARRSALPGTPAKGAGDPAVLPGSGL